MWRKHRSLFQDHLKFLRVHLREYKDSDKDLAGDKWTLRNLTELFTEDFKTWAKSEGLDNNGDAYLGLDK